MADLSLQHERLAEDAQRPGFGVSTGLPRQMVEVGPIGGARLGPAQQSDFDIRKMALIFVTESIDTTGAEAAEIAADYVAAAKIFEAYLRGDDKTEA